MCAYTLTLDDRLVDEIRPRFADEAAMKSWLQKELELILIYHAGVNPSGNNFQSSATLTQDQLEIKDSLSRAYDELKTGKVKHNARNLFKQ